MNDNEKLMVLTYLVKKWKETQHFNHKKVAEKLQMCCIRRIRIKQPLEQLQWIVNLKQIKVETFICFSYFWDLLVFSVLTELFSTKFTTEKRFSLKYPVAWHRFGTKFCYVTNKRNFLKLLYVIGLEKVVHRSHCKWIPPKIWTHYEK